MRSFGSQWVAVALAALCACGRIRFDEGAPGAFGEPRLVVALVSNVNDRSPTTTDDRLELYYQSNMTTEGPIYVSVRTSSEAAWPSAAQVPELTSPVRDRGPEVSGTGLTLWLSSERSTGKLEIHVATRASRQSAWSPPAPAPGLEGIGAEGPSVVPSGQLMAFNARIDSLGNSDDIYLVTRASTLDPWGPPTPVISVNTTAHERNPFLHRGGLDLYFDREGAIFRATRTTLDEPFGAPVLIPELDDPDANDEEFWLSSDGHYGLMTSDRHDQGLNGEVYEFDGPGL